MGEQHGKAMNSPGLLVPARVFIPEMGLVPFRVLVPRSGTEHLLQLCSDSPRLRLRKIVRLVDAQMGDSTATPFACTTQLSYFRTNKATMETMIATIDIAMDTQLRFEDDSICFLF